MKNSDLIQATVFFVPHFRSFDLTTSAVDHMGLCGEHTILITVFLKANKAKALRHI